MEKAEGQHLNVLRRLLECLSPSPGSLRLPGGMGQELGHSQGREEGGIIYGLGLPSLPAQPTPDHKGTLFWSPWDPRLQSALGARSTTKGAGRQQLWRTPPQIHIFDVSI